MAPGQVYCEVETDKATISWESQEEGEDGGGGGICEHEKRKGMKSQDVGMGGCAEGQKVVEAGWLGVLPGSGEWAEVAGRHGWAAGGDGQEVLRGCTAAGCWPEGWCGASDQDSVLLVRRSLGKHNEENWWSARSPGVLEWAATPIVKSPGSRRLWLRMPPCCVRTPPVGHLGERPRVAAAPRRNAGPRLALIASPHARM